MKRSELEKKADFLARVVAPSTFTKKQLKVIIIEVFEDQVADGPRDLIDQLLGKADTCNQDQEEDLGNLGAPN